MTISRNRTTDQSPNAASLVANRRISRIVRTRGGGGSGGGSAFGGTTSSTTGSATSTAPRSGIRGPAGSQQAREPLRRAKRSGLQHRTVGQHHDLIAAAHRREPVRDDDADAVA
jgi:hypothetical protein